MSANIIGKVKVTNVSFNDVPVLTVDEIGAELVDAEPEFVTLSGETIRTADLKQDHVRARLLELYNQVVAERDAALAKLDAIYRIAGA